MLGPRGVSLLHGVVARAARLYTTMQSSTRARWQDHRCSYSYRRVENFRGLVLTTLEGIMQVLMLDINADHSDQDGQKGLYQVFIIVNHGTPEVQNITIDGFWVS